MKRLLLIAAILGGAALVPLAAQAQRGGHGVASAHMGGGFAARPAGRIAPMGAVRPMGMRATPLNTRFIPGQRSFFPNNRFGFRFHHRNRFFFNGFNNCFSTFGTGFGCANPFLFGGLGFGGLGYGMYDPFFDPFYSGLNQQPQQPVVVQEDQGNDREVAFEVQALRDEITAMREENLAREQARNNPPPRPAASQEEANAVLVFRDGRQLVARNYAIADHTIWVLSANNARKIPVSELDLEATQQANAKNGVDFHLPQH